MVNVARSVPLQILPMLIENNMGGHIIKYTSSGILYEAQTEEQRREEEADDDIPAGCYAPRISIEGKRHIKYKRKESFECEGTMFRHTAVSWRDAPVQFKSPHKVEADEDGNTCYSYEHKIEDLDPFGCEIYWKTIWDKCTSCFEADNSFMNWAIQASSPERVTAIQAAQRKRKAHEGKLDGKEDSKVRKGALKTEE